jgi:hypothetical protein
MRKGPRLTAEVLNILHCQTDLLLDLPHHSPFEWFTRLYKPGENAIHARKKVARSGKQKFVVALDKNDDCRSEAGKVEQTALDTFF